MYILSLKPGLIECPKCWQGFIESLRIHLVDRYMGFTDEELNNELSVFGAKYIKNKDETGNVKFIDIEGFLIFKLKFG